ncbi:uncharacterized protein LOC124944589 [Impatiens glandulifera]|uniref:uncharacterized protein LOC124944589 n=1 Tax=Impatiens glandulifera TaxID=253017 RepID=UPI001FB0A887|nr:uncharacterized protein LOC124944589 [Impatiens glandulifera]
MGLDDNRDGTSFDEIELSDGAKPIKKGQSPISVSVSRKGLVTGDPQNGMKKSSTGLTHKFNFLKFGSLSSPSVKFQRFAKGRDDISRRVPSSTSEKLKERFRRVFSGKINMKSLCEMGKEWIRNPMNMALFVWILGVAVSGAILFLVMTGMLNAALPKKSQRDTWFEVNNQILNALFTLMCLYQHPKRLYHLVLLLRWRPEDISRLRKIYCKNGTYKPHEWAHIMVVVILLNINCFAQYGLCGLNLGYRRSNRPAIGVAVCISFAIGAPAIAGVYSMVSPLGKEYEFDFDEESQTETSTADRRASLERRFSFATKEESRVIETQPKWSGGIFDFWDDISMAYLSLFCSFCVFGWNMERLGFGNMYVHIATFLLFCLAPFWIFNLAAINIDNEMVREALGITGIFLCIFGLLYGGFWRIQMRKRFHLPSYSFCCGKPAIADCALWLCCCWCSLAQEVRTGNAYDIMEDKFCHKQDNDEGLDSQSPMLSPLPREDGERQYRSGSSSPFRNVLPPASFSSPKRVELPNSQPSSVEEEKPSTRMDDKTMEVPAPIFIVRDSN